MKQVLDGIRRYSFNRWNSVQSTDTDQYLDCSNWPAGTYIVTETYQNGLGQTTSDTLELVIVNKPPPHFTIQVTGSDAVAGTPCTITHVAAQGEDHQDYTKDWRVTPSIGLIANSSTLDCSKWDSGVYKILLTVTMMSKLALLVERC